MDVSKVGNAPVTGEARFDFIADARAVMGDLRVSVAAVLSGLGGISKPADLQKATRLDKTLCWQIFKIAASPDALGSGSAVPSRTSLVRFLDAAAARGVTAGRVDAVMAAYDAFERLVDLHAGDRVTFNSMVSAAAGLDEEWLAADLQHRRNVFRGISHAMGVQAKVRLSCFVAVPGRTEGLWDVVFLAGFVGMRILRAMPSVRVHGSELLGRQADVIHEPLQPGPDGAMGFLLADYSSKPLPRLTASERRTTAGRWYEIALDWPDVGNTGTSTLVFGEVFRDFPPCDTHQEFNAVTGRPVELMFHDMLIAPELIRDAVPSVRCTWPAGRAGGADPVPVEGVFDLERLGRGPDALATPELPNYPDMLRLAGQRLGRDLGDCEAIRVRVEYPLYQTMVGIDWRFDTQEKRADPQ